MSSRATVHRQCFSILLLLFFAPIAALPALEWQTDLGHRHAAILPPTDGTTGFTWIAPAACGIVFNNFLPESRHLTNQILLNGSGVAAGDVDGDGWCDLYFCRADGGNTLYRNLGQWKFQDITAAAGAGIDCANLTSTGCALADLNGDRHLDLIVNTPGHGTRIFFNDGRGHFTAAPYVLNQGRGGMSLAVGDIDGDGQLDLYIANYRTSGLMDVPNARATFKKVAGQTVMETFNGRPVSAPDLRDRFTVGPRGSLEENGEPDALYRNADGTNFVAVPFTGGAFLDADGRPLAKPPFDWGLSVMMRDVNRDGRPDIYVCNDFQTEDRLWLNQGGGQLRLAPALTLRKTSRFSMGIDFADLNRDGHDDFLVLDMLSRSHAHRRREISEIPPLPSPPGRFEDRPQVGMNTLFLNRGDGTYTEIAQLAGLAASEWSWACVFLDVDLDGWEDVLISNGMERAARDADVAERIKALRASRPLTDAEIFQARKAFPRLATANLAFRNRGDLTFEEVGAAWRFNLAGVSQGMALADLDNDGDLDVIVNNLNAAAAVYRNDSPAPRLAVRLRGATPNTGGVGARITVTAAGLPAQSQEIIAGGRYLSSDEPIRTFAAGHATNRLKVEVLWPSGRRSEVEHATANRIYEIQEPTTATVQSQKAEGPRPAEAASGATSLFTDATALLGHMHVENVFDDFERQPLLPRRISQLGPGAAWFDVNDDGWDDLILGSGKGGNPAAFENDRRGGFRRADAAFTKPPTTRDHAGLLAWRDASGGARVIIAFSNFEDGLALGAGLREFNFTSGAVSDLAPAQRSSFGPLALGALDGAGPLALFAGGRVIPGQYPAAASSLVLRQRDGGWVVDEENSKVLREVGLVSGAVWSDLTGDGFPELILACEWGPVKIFRNTRGRLAAWNPVIEVQSPRSRAQGQSPAIIGADPKLETLAALTGFWTSVATGDFDGDGRIDLAAGSWGRNTSYESQRARPLRIHFNDLDGNGSVEIIESHYDAESQQYVPWRNLTALARVLPSARARFTSHAAFAKASLEEILGDESPRWKVLEAAWLESTVFLNRDTNFIARALPIEAQFAPAFGLVAADFDGDGSEDLLMAQNFFGTPPEVPRLDGGRALLLRGDGRGEFTAASGRESGVMIYGEQRAAAASDLDHDGRLDLVVTQNGAATRLLRNSGAKPGWRVRLKGRPDNPDGIGAVLRIKSTGRFSPAREIQAGSGYWSQNSATQVLAVPTGAGEIEVRWPDGKLTTTAAPMGARELLIEQK